MAQRDLQHAGTVPLEPGQLDRYVEIQQPEDPDAGFVVWIPFSVAWMRKRDLRHNERFVANQLSATVDTMWELGYRADMDPELLDVAKLRRLVYQGRPFDVVGGSQIGRRQGIELTTLALPFPQQP